MERLKDLRKINKMDRNELADKLGVSFSTIAAYEQGIREPSIENMIKLSHIFDCSIDYLIGNDILSCPKQTKEDLSLDDIVTNFIKDIKKQIRNEIRAEIKFQLECENLSEIAAEVKHKINI